MNLPLRILHLEDNANDAEIVHGVLAGGGIDCEVQRVETRDEFTAALDAGGFDLILADFSLPSFDGLSALDLALARRADVPFIFVSGTLGEEVAIDALKIGATDYVLKERLSRLVTSVTRALRETRARAERKLAEQQLRRSEAFLAEGQRISHTGSWGWSISSGKVVWSGEQYRMFGLEPGAVEPSVELFLALVHPDDRARVRQIIEDVPKDRQPYAIDYRIVLPDGSLRHLRSEGLPVATESAEIDEYIGTTVDVTERVLTEAALKRSEERYALAMSATGEGHWDWNPATDEFYASPRMFELAGFAPATGHRGMADFLGRCPIHPDDRRTWQQAMTGPVTDDRVRFDLEIRTLAHGTEHWLHIRGLCSLDEAGTAVRWTGTASDVTDRKGMELALRQSSERYALAVEAANEGHSDWNLETGEFYVSPRLLEICGHPPGFAFKDRAEWVQKFPFHPEDRPRWEQALAAHMAGTGLRFHVEVRIVVRGETRWVRFVFLSTRDASGKPIRWTGSTSDITERKRAEEELRARQQMLELAQKAARAVAFEWRITPGGTQNIWSHDLEAMYGVAAGAYDGTLDAWKRLVHPEDWPIVRDAMEHAPGELALEFRVVPPRGGVRWLQAKGRMYSDDDGRPARIVGFMLDVTERRHAEEELRRLEARLRHSQRLEAMGTLAGGIAHDFNNILGAILGYGERAVADTARGTRLRRDIESILAAGERGRALVDRVLTLSRSGVGERTAVHVEGVVREALDLLAAKLPADIVVEADLQAGRAAMQGDPTEVHQVLMNLATNAIHAMPDGGTLRVSLKTEQLSAARVATVGAVAAGEHIVLQVADSGTGIRPEILHRIFDPFFTTKEVNVGTGLGLSLVHGIVMDAGGAIDLASTVGAGCCFTVYLPRSGDVADAEDVAEQAVPLGGGQRVLFVDDEEPLVRLATETLEELGYAPVGFTSSAAALEAFRADPRSFDAVITDERMPGISGSTLIRAVRGIRRTVPIVLVSGNVGGMVASRAYNAGANEVLKKPLSTRELATSLARVLQD